MLYVSTRNPADHHTAYRAIHEFRAPDGGFFVPFRLPVLAREEVIALRSKSLTDVIAKILNMLFGLRLNGWDVECAIGRNPFKVETVGQRNYCVEAWRNPEGCWEYLIKNLYRLIAKNEQTSVMPEGWAYIAIQVALLFGIYSAVETLPASGFDIAVPTGDLSDILAISYAKDMGLPINMTLCTCNENSSVWEFINKGTFNPGATTISTAIPELDISLPSYMECFVFKVLGVQETMRYLSCCDSKTVYAIDTEQVETLRNNYYASVVSAERADALQSSLRKTSQYSVDICAALSYGGLQNYRANTGLSKDTFLLAKRRPK